MSKTSLTIGLFFSICIHMILLFPEENERLISTNQPEREEKKKMSVKLPHKPEKNKRIETVAKPPEPEPKVNKLDNVVKAQSPKPELNRRPGDFPDSQEEAFLPPLRLVWESPGQLMEISRKLGMRIVGIKDGDIVGELSLNSSAELKSFKGDLRGFSNRVRTISPKFFAKEVLVSIDAEIHSFWILVPSELDRRWVLRQKQEIRSRGIDNGEVSYMEAKIVFNGEDHILVITKIVRA